MLCLFRKYYKQFVAPVSNVGGFYLRFLASQVRLQSSAVGGGSILSTELDVMSNKLDVDITDLPEQEMCIHLG